MALTGAVTAGTAGTVGPDLDAAFRRARAHGLGAGTISGIVEEQILHPGRRSRMPAELVGRLTTVVPRAARRRMGPA